MDFLNGCQEKILGTRKRLRIRVSAYPPQQASNLVSNIFRGTASMWLGILQLSPAKGNKGWILEYPSMLQELNTMVAGRAPVAGYSKISPDRSSKSVAKAIVN